MKIPLAVGVFGTLAVRTHRPSLECYAQGRAAAIRKGTRLVREEAGRDRKAANRQEVYRW